MGSISLKPEMVSEPREREELEGKSLAPMKTTEHAQDMAQQACGTDSAQSLLLREEGGITPLSRDCFGPKRGTGLEKKQEDIRLGAELLVVENS